MSADLSFLFYVPNEKSRQKFNVSYVLFMDLLHCQNVVFVSGKVVSTIKNECEYLSLETRRKVTMLLFLRDIIKGRIKEHNVLSKVNINVPQQNSRSRKAFHLSVMQASILRLSILGGASEIYIAYQVTLA